MTNKIVKFILFSLVLILLSCQCSSPLKQSKNENVIANSSATKESKNEISKPIFIPKPTLYGFITIEGQKVKFNVNYYSPHISSPLTGEDKGEGEITKKLRILALPCNTMVKQKVFITGIGILAPMYANGADPVTKLINGPAFPAGSCNIAATVSTVPYGRRVGTVSGYTSGDMEIAGTNVKAVFDVSAPVTNVEICYRGTPSGKVVEDIITAGKNWIATTMNLANLQTLIDNITGKAGVSPNYTYTTHPVLVKDTTIANDLIANGGDPTLLNPLNAAYKITPGQITGTIAGLVSTDKATITINDPISAVSANNSNGAFSMNGIPPGNWTVKISSTGYTVSSEPVANVTEGGTTNVGTITLTPPTPNITSLVPNAGAVGASIQINGTNFHSNTDGNVVKFGTVNATVTAASTTQLTGTVPGGISGTVGVTVSVGSQTSNSSNYTVYELPTITNFTPTQGTNGTSVTITGTKFTGATAVKFNGVNASSFIIDNDTQITATVANNSKTGTVSVTNPAGTANSTLDFVYMKWAFTAGGAIKSSPAIGSDGTIYVGSDNFKLYAINPDGTQKWNYTTGGTVSYSPAIGTDGTIYVGSADKNLYAIDSNGNFQWSYLTTNTVTSPAIDGEGTIYIMNKGLKLYAINSDGTQKWVDSTGLSDSSPAIGNNIYIYAKGNGFFSSMDSTNGSISGIFMTPNNPLPVINEPAINNDGTIYCEGLQVTPRLIAFNSNYNSIKWSTVVGFASSSPAIGSDGTIYVTTTTNKRLYAIKPDGTINWNFLYGGVSKSSPAIGSDSIIYFGCDDFKLYAVNPDGTQKWTYTTGNTVQSNPAIANDGTIYVGSTDGKLYAIDSNSAGLADTPWPKYHANNKNTSLVNSLVISHFSPIEGNTGTNVSIYGNHFTGTTSVKFNGVEASSFIVNSDTKITATVPITTSGTLSITSPEGTRQSCMNFMIVSGNNFAVSNAPNFQYGPVIAYNSTSNQYLVTWQDWRSGNYDIYAQRVNSDDTLNGVNFIVSNDPSEQYAPVIAYNNTNNEYLVTWDDGRNGNGDIYAQRVNADGTLNGANFVVANDPASQFAPTIAYNNTNNEYLVMWMDYRSGNAEIYAQKVNANGTLNGANFVVTAISNPYIGSAYLTIAYNSISNQYLVTWTDNRSGNNDIYAQRVNANGTLNGANFVVANDLANQECPAIAYNSTNNEYLVTWQDWRSGNNDDIYAQRVNANGTLIGANFVVANDPASQSTPAIAYNSINNVYLVTWTADNGCGKFFHGIFAQRVNADGTLNGANFGISNDASSPFNAYNSTNNKYLISFQNGQPDIYAKIVDAP